MMKSAKDNGYVAIITAVIVSVILGVIVFTMSLGSFLGRENSLGLHLKEKSRGLAEACVETARLKIVQNPNYIGGENINVASDTCRIISVANLSGNSLISAQGSYQRIFTNLEATIRQDDASILDWQEKARFQ